jgi:hypothetical protein
VRQLPGGGNWWGRAQKRKSWASAISSVRLSDSRKSLCFDGPIEASQAAFDLCAGRLEIDASGFVTVGKGAELGFDTAPLLEY